jgi:hypothetical protein
MKSKYFWLKTKGRPYEIEQKEYLKLTNGKHTLVQVCGNQLIISNDSHFLYLDREKLQDALMASGF